MKPFYEKADSTILEECKNFIEKNVQTIADYCAYREALRLFIKLSESLIASHEDFEEAIKEETNKLLFLEDGTEKDVAVIKFVQANYRLVLDVEAHRILNQLEMIYKSYSPQ